MTIHDEFMRQHWSYYLVLEKDFAATEQYLAIDPLNFKAFSNEYIKQYQTICSEIDVIAKAFCRELDTNFNGNTINSYCKCIIDNNADFVDRNVRLEKYGLILHPWKDWSYTSAPQADGTPQIIYNTPTWWKKYNKIKHDRTSTDESTGLQYYKFANQENVLNALSALFQLEMYYYRTLWKKFFQNAPDVPDYTSTLFEIKDWGNKWIMIGSNFAIQTD